MYSEFWLVKDTDDDSFEREIDDGPAISDTNVLNFSKLLWYKISISWLLVISSMILNLSQLLKIFDGFHLNWFWMIHSYVWWSLLRIVRNLSYRSMLKKVILFQNLFDTRLNDVMMNDRDNWRRKFVQDNFLIWSVIDDKKKSFPSVKVRKVLRNRIHVYKLQVEAHDFWQSSFIRVSYECNSSDSSLSISISDVILILFSSYYYIKN